MNRQPQIVGLPTDDEIQRIDRRSKEEVVLIAWKGIRIGDRILAIAAEETVEIVARAAGQGIVTGAAGELIRTTATRHRVIASAPQQLIVAGTAVQTIDAIAAAQHIVTAPAGQGIVAVSAVSRIIARTAIQGIVAAIAEKHVVGGTARAVDAGRSRQGEIFDVRPEREGDAAFHRIGALISRFRHHIAGLVHHIGIIARAPDHRVAAQPAVQAIVARPSIQDVVGAVAEEDMSCALPVPLRATVPVKVRFSTLAPSV